MDRTHVARELTRITNAIRTGSSWDAVGDMETLIHEHAPHLAPIIQPRHDYGNLDEQQAIVDLAKASNAVAPTIETAMSIVYMEARINEAMTLALPFSWRMG